MKMLTLLISVLLSSQAFAAANLYCTAEDGTTIHATESADSGTLFDFRFSVRGGEVKSYPDAYAAGKEEVAGKVTFLVVTDSQEGILAVVKDGSLYDATGVYEVEACEISM